MSNPLTKESAVSGDQPQNERNVIERPDDNISLALLLQLSVFTVVGGLLLVLAPEGPWSLRLLIIALVFLTLKRWGGVLVLILVQGDLMLREGREFAVLNGATGVAFAFVVVAVLMFVARNRQLLLQSAGGSLIRQARTLLNAPENDGPIAADSGAAALRIFASGLRGLLVVFGCVMVSGVLMAMLPDNRDLTGGLRRAVNADPPMIVGATILVAIVAAWVAISEISWRQMTASQARMYQRSVFVKLHYRDLRMVVMRRLKMRRQRGSIVSASTKNESQSQTSGMPTESKQDEGSKRG